MKNKKRGAITEGITDLFAYGAFILMIILFYFLFSLGSHDIKVNIEGQIQQVKGDTILLDLMRQPTYIESDGKEKQINFGEMIRLWYHDKDTYDSILQDKGNELLNQMEYEYFSKKRNKKVIRGYQIFINDKEPENNKLVYFKGGRIKSNNYEKTQCLIIDHGCGNLGGTFIPVSESEKIFIGLRLSDLPIK